ncbi:MAG: hypothetical protein CMM94_02050 [Rickettsiales bacterium]|nr:hypothetical protein [Rickettsiales bacterium]
MGKIISLSGWAQPADALALAMPNAVAVDYAHFTSTDMLWRYLHSLGEIDGIVGWSFGGQLAARAVSQGALQVKWLALLAAPYQFVSDGDVLVGMGPQTFHMFRENYVSNPQRTMKRFHGLITKDDAHQRKIIAQLGYHSHVEEVDVWMPWLDNLARHSMDECNLQHMPPTLLVQGENDAIVAPEQADRWAAMLPHAKVDMWSGCSHAPHLHAPSRMLQTLEKWHKQKAG